MACSLMHMCIYPLLRLSLCSISVAERIELLDDFLQILLGIYCKPCKLCEGASIHLASTSAIHITLAITE